MSSLWWKWIPSSRRWIFRDQSPRFLVCWTSATRIGEVTLSSHRKFFSVLDDVDEPDEFTEELRKLLSDMLDGDELDDVLNSPLYDQWKTALRLVRVDAAEKGPAQVIKVIDLMRLKLQPITFKEMLLRTVEIRNDLLKRAMDPTEGVALITAIMHDHRNDVQDVEIQISACTLFCDMVEWCKNFNGKLKDIGPHTGLQLKATIFRELDMGYGLCISVMKFAHRVYQGKIPDDVFDRLALTFWRCLELLGIQCTAKRLRNTLYSLVKLEDVKPRQFETAITGFRLMQEAEEEVACLATCYGATVVIHRAFQHVLSDISEKTILAVYEMVESLKKWEAEIFAGKVRIKSMEENPDNKELLDLLSGKLSPDGEALPPLPGTPEG
mmetsp:Transcript_34787/g.90790  ORF Transcript_34787/g.90790 Transcript_34787/m.90790 type:complete len:382 (+) Transcript_34787:722-1867(+)